VNYTANRAELQQRASDLFEWIAAGKLRVRIDRTYPLAQAAEAHRALAGRETMGKILLIP
jgi:NADPH2:quinone reductase